MISDGPASGFARSQGLTACPRLCGMADNYAVVITARETAALLPEEPDRSPLSPTEVSGRTIASVVSGGTELNGMYQATTFPQRPGYAACFRVDEVGKDVTC